LHVVKIQRSQGEETIASLRKRVLQQWSRAMMWGFTRHFGKEKGGGKHGRGNTNHKFYQGKMFEKTNRGQKRQAKCWARKGEGCKRGG